MLAVVQKSSLITMFTSFNKGAAKGTPSPGKQMMPLSRMPAANLASLAKTQKNTRHEKAEAKCCGSGGGGGGGGTRVLIM